MATLPIKLVVIGDTGVGKTSLLLQFVNGTFTDTASETAQVDMISCSITIDGRKHDLDVWDTAGQERFDGVTSVNYRKAIGGIVVYDSTNEESFEDAEQWIEDVGTYADPKVKIILVGNKCDLKEKQVVDASSAQGMAKSKGILFIETSAKGDINVKQLFEMLVREIVKESTQQTQPQTQGIKLENDKGNQNHNSKCCK